MKSFRNWVKETRAKQHLSQQDAITRANEVLSLNKSPETWRMWENRKVDLPHDLIKRVAAGLDTPEIFVSIAAGVIPSEDMQEHLMDFAHLCPEQRRIVQQMTQELRAQGCPQPK